MMDSFAEILRQENDIEQIQFAKEIDVFLFDKNRFLLHYIIDKIIGENYVDR